MQTFVGTSGFSYTAWKGSFYPKEMKPDGFLTFYAERFGAVEINNTFYRMPKKDMLQKWIEQVPSTFTFAVKASQSITHMRRLKDVSGPLGYFYEVTDTLGAQRGPALFQLHPAMKKDLGRLTDFLDLLPAGAHAALEFRNESWFDDEVYSALRDHNAALCVSDMEEESTPFVATADWGYLRLRRGDYDEASLATWLERIHGQGWSEANVFFKHEDEARGPVFATRFIEMLP